MAAGSHHLTIVLKFGPEMLRQPLKFLEVKNPRWRMADILKIAMALQPFDGFR